MNGFFSPAKHDFNRAVINIGGEQFHAVAVALIDHLNKGARLNETSLKKILERFYFYFPKHRGNQPYLTPSERMKMLILNVRKSELVECLAFVLRQLTIDEIYENPLRYREVFDGLERSTPKEYLRQNNRGLPTSALSALVQILGVTLVLSYVEHGKELRKREVYGLDSGQKSSMELVLQVQGEHYFPQVKNKSDFAYVGQLAVLPPKPEHLEEDLGTVAKQFDEITYDNKQRLQTYIHLRQNLLTMVQLGELATKKLLDLYIEFFPTKRGDLSDPVNFFAKLTHTEDNPVMGEVDKSSQLNELLASSLAAWISAKQVDADQLFDSIEQSSLQQARLG